jgi:hypothetical protein
VIDEKYVNMDYVVELNDVKESFDLFSEETFNIIDSILLGMDELLQLIEPILGFLPMTLDAEQEKVVSKFVALYVLMIQRNLKTINEVPERLRMDVENSL